MTLASAGASERFASVANALKDWDGEQAPNRQSIIADVSESVQPGLVGQSPAAPDAAESLTLIYNKGLLTIQQAASYLAVSIRTVKQLLSDGRVAYVKIGRATRITKDDLDGYIDQNKRKRRTIRRAL